MGNSTSFKKGNKPTPRNPAVDPAVKRLKTQAQRHGPEVVRYLVQTMQDVELNRSDRTAAAKEILDRGYGKATTLVGGDAGVAAVRVVIQGDDAKL